MSISNELLRIANQLDKYEDYDSSKLDALEKAAITIGRSWSGSWIGYQSRVYYADFQPPLSGVTFSKLSGLNSSTRTHGNWKEYTREEISDFIHEQAGNSSVGVRAVDIREATEIFEKAQESTLSLVHANYDLESNKFLANLAAKIESLKISTEDDFIKDRVPSDEIASKDMRALEGGWAIPIHILVLSMVHGTRAPFQSCKDLKKQIVSLANHIQNIKKSTMQEHKIGNKIFIGHGHSPDWREFKDFINDRLGLPWDEFNRVPVAGVTNIARLTQMLNQSCMAFLVMTAEDEQADGTLHARMNVVHEAGLFQGKLGFKKAIILLEDECEEFSNIYGLNQIRFSKGNISASFEEVRRVLEREGIIE